MAGIFNRTKTIEVPLTISETAYSAGDVVGGLIDLDVHSAGGGGVVRRVILVDEDGKDAVFTLYFFDRPPQTIADDAAFEPDAADVLRLIGTVEIAAADYLDLNNTSVALKGDLGMDYTAVDGRLYVYLVCTATPNYDNDDALTLRVTVWAD
jgi:hypothetical protein